MNIKDKLNTVILGECMEVMRTFPENSIDAVVTDPPYELGFMGKSWDATGIAYNVSMWKEVLRVLKPGGHLLSFGGSRTYHRMACAIEDAGFGIRDMVEFLYGSGFPKSLAIGKSLDKKLGNEREVIGKRSGTYADIRRNKETGQDGLHGGIATERSRVVVFETKGDSPWEGWGTALKPAHEPICLARKPLSEKTVVENVLKWGVGGLNIDGCRIGIDLMADKSQLRTMNRNKKTEDDGWGMNNTKSDIPQVVSLKGRFPSNLILDEEAGKLLDQQSGQRKSGGKVKGTEKSSPTKNDYGVYGRIENEPYLDVGGASRFFYCAKASKAERNKGCGHLPYQKAGGMAGRNDGSFDGKITYNNNNHPTVKPLALMKYLITLITPPNAIVLDPFAGSGSTLVAAKELGFNFIGIEKEVEYKIIADARLAATSWKDEKVPDSVIGRTEPFEGSSSGSSPDPAELRKALFEDGLDLLR